MQLSCQNLCFSYAQRPVLTGVSLELSAGEIVALLGPNGSGKSTLLRCVLGQLSASGTILWDGKPLSTWRGRDLARRVAYLAQSHAVDAMLRVSDVLRLGRAPYLPAFGLESERDVQVVREVAQMLALDDLLDRRLDELSGGQRQQVLLGRCLVQEPSVLLLDEPNTFLDLRHQVELGQRLRDLARSRNIAVLMASHDLNLAGQFSTRLALLSQGKIIADGSPAQVLTPELLSKVYGVPMQRIERDGDVYVFPQVSNKGK